MTRRLMVQWAVPPRSEQKGITSRIYRKNVRENQGAATAGVHHTHSCPSTQPNDKISTLKISNKCFSWFLHNDFEISRCFCGGFMKSVLKFTQVWRITLIKCVPLKLHKLLRPFRCHESSRKPQAQSFWNNKAVERFLQHKPQPAAGDPKTQLLHLTQKESLLMHRWSSAS